MTGSRPTLAQRTTLRVGGAADEWIIATTEDELVDAVRRCDRSGTPVLLLGGGSNLLVADDGFPGAVVEIATRGLVASPVAEGDSVRVTAQAGEPWDELVSRAVANGWAGVEALSGIPGLVGATPVQNVGAYGQEIADVLTTVRVLDRSSGTVLALDAADCGFGYRSSIFKSQPHRWVVLEVALKLDGSGEGVVRYADVARELGLPMDARASVGAIRGAVLALRARKGMVLTADDHDTWSAGSFFTNPVLDEATAAGLPADCPRYPCATGVKVSAAWLIQNAGIEPGYALPGSRAAISTKHTLALTNRGGATASELLALAEDVRRRVRGAFGIELEPEPTVAGPIGV